MFEGVFKRVVLSASDIKALIFSVRGPLRTEGPIYL